MTIRFNRLVRAGQDDIQERIRAELYLDLSGKRADDTTMVFMSHKTGDVKAVTEAKYITDTHGVVVYMAEWDDEIDSDSDSLPDYIMQAIQNSDGFLVNVIAEIAVSMWIGYEVGGAHAMKKPRAKIMYDAVHRLPTVVGVLKSLRRRSELDQWIIKHVL